MIFISDEDVRRHVSFDAVCAAIERAFIALDAGDSRNFDVAIGAGGGDGHFFAVKSGRDGAIPSLGLKAGSYVPDNAARGLPAHSSATMLIDDRTGRLTAVVEANYLNCLRTAAANALATRKLARANASTLGLIGAGDQAVFEAIAVASVRPIRRVLAASRTGTRNSHFADQIHEHLKLPVEFADAQFVTENADVLVTVTPARQPVVRAAWVRPGTHISAMGADAVGKQELDVELMARARVFVDSPPQAARIGECQHAIGAGILDRGVLESMTLGRLLRQPGSGRMSDEEITIFDSSGLAIQDIAAAHAAVTCVQSQVAEQGGGRASG